MPPKRRKMAEASGCSQSKLGTDFPPGAIVWVKLGPSYGHWPCTIYENELPNPAKDENVNCSNVDLQRDPNFGSKQTERTDFKAAKRIRFFDDDKYEAYSVQNLSQLQAYQCAEKLDLIRAGIETFSVEKPNCLLDNATRRDQFIKDVELAEVLSMDCDPAVAQLLGELVHLDQPVNEDPEAPSTSSRPGRGKKGGSRGRGRKRP
eukprot:maker-scaffold84_size396325-snap-gene-1.17 protein:Tk09683 transcript:maker-scaffold84_size396325-snap-gene-1.17-mRNA-1 annotation:"hypothetical protein EAI_02228"